MPADPSADVSVHCFQDSLKETSSLFEKEHEKVFSLYGSDIRLSPVILAFLSSAVACDFPGVFVTAFSAVPLALPYGGFHRLREPSDA